MGQRASTMVSDVADDDETVFMVPSYINLSVDQMNVMLNAGQQPGVPFRLAAGGAERPQGVRKKVWFAENRVAIQKSTIKLVESDDDEGCYALEFLYDASVPAVVKVLVGARDVVGAVKGAVTLADTVVSYGPYVLREGRNRAWSSVRDGDGAAVQWQQLLRHRAVHHAQQATVGGGADGLVATSQPERVYDVVVVLAPADALATCPLLAAPSPTAAVASAAMHRGTAPGDDGKPPARLHSASSPGNKNLRKVSPTGSRAPSLAGKGLGATLGLGLGLARGGGEEKDGDGDRARQAAVSVLCEVTYCLAGPAAALAVDAATLQALARDADRLRGPLSSAAGSSARGGAADVLSARDVSLAPTATPINPFGAAIAVRCASQRVQLASGGVYAIQDIYGMDRNRTEEVSASAGDGAAGGEEGGMALDADAVECVICLTDPRVIAVYPCRHMCLCASCAEVLPSQGNKCPICRRAAAMLLCIDSSKPGDDAGAAAAPGADGVEELGDEEEEEDDEDEDEEESELGGSPQRPGAGTGTGTGTGASADMDRIVDAQSTGSSGRLLH